jgi:hypothetical protein
VKTYETKKESAASSSRSHRCHCIFLPRVHSADKDKHAKEESFVSCFASTQEPKTKTIGVTAATAIAAGTDEIQQKEKPSPSHTDSLQQEQQVVTHLNPATDIVLVPFTQGSDNNAETDSGADLMLYKIVCDYMEDVWSAGDGEDRLQLWQEIAAKVRFLNGAERNQATASFPNPIGDYLCALSERRK